MPRGAGLPGDGRLLGLLGETSKAGLGGQTEFGLSGLQDRGQQHIQLDVLARAQQHALPHGIETAGYRGVAVFMLDDNCEGGPTAAFSMKQCRRPSSAPLAATTIAG